MRTFIPLLLLLLPLPLLAQSRPAPSASQPASRPIDYYALAPADFSKLPILQTHISKSTADIPLLEAAIFHESNRQRAAAHLPLFKHGLALTLMGRRHSQEMADLQFFDHQSPTPANRTLADRLKNVGLVNITAGENIAVLPAKEIGSGRYIIHPNPDGTETWNDEVSGKVVDYNTYENLAAAFVASWMNSPPHRDNLLDKRFLFLGIGAARGPYTEKAQDSFYLTQNFSALLSPAAEAKAAPHLAAPPSPASPAAPPR